MNRIKLSGTITSDFAKSHTSFGEQFYSFAISSQRKSGEFDKLRCVISEALLPDDMGITDMICVNGEIRTRNVEDENSKKHTEVFVFVKGIEDYPGHDTNYVEGRFYICRKTSVRETPLGRVLIDFIGASNRENSDKSDYIPIIAWGRGATRIDAMPIGTQIDVVGRLQSREYVKRYEDGSEETKTAYELSSGRFEVSANED